MVAVDLERCANLAWVVYHTLEEGPLLGQEHQEFIWKRAADKHTWAEVAKAVLLAAGASLSEAKPTLGDTQAVLPQPPKCLKTLGHTWTKKGDLDWCSTCGSMRAGFAGDDEPSWVPSCWQT